MVRSPSTKAKISAWSKRMVSSVQFETRPGQNTDLVADGSGWLKIKPSAPGSIAGLVPASYAELNPKMSRSFTSDRPLSTASGSTSSLPASEAAVPAKKKGPAVAPRRGAKKLRHVEALYTYSAANEGEVDMVEGERMVLLQADQGDGWCEVEARAGRGMVPAGWCKEV